MKKFFIASLFALFTLTAHAEIVTQPSKVYTDKANGYTMDFYTAGGILLTFPQNQGQIMCHITKQENTLEYTEWQTRCRIQGYYILVRAYNNSNAVDLYFNERNGWKKLATFDKRKTTVRQSWFIYRSEDW